MAITVTEDIVNGNRFRETSKGISFVRVFLVEGLDPANPANAIVACQQPAIPKYLSVIAVAGASYMWCNEIEGRPRDRSRSKIDVTCTYSSAEFSNGNLTQTVVEVTGSNSLKRIYRWPTGSTPGGKNDGKLIYIAYQQGQTFPVPIDASSIPAPGVYTAAQQSNYPAYDVGSVEQLSPNTILTFHRWIQANATNGPLGLSKSYRRKTNKLAWQGGTPGTWLCRQFDSRSVGSPFGANVLFEQTIAFEYDPDGFTQYALFQNQYDGKAVQGINIADKSNNGYTPVSYPTANFAALNLPTVY